MKNQFFTEKSKILAKILLLVIFTLCFMGFNTLRAQVNFTQTLNADFNKGVLNNVVVNSDNVYLQFAASDVGSWLTTTVLPQTLTGHKAVSWIDKYAYLVGGFNNTTYSNAVYVASISAGGISGWTALNPLPVAMKDPAVVIGTNTIYVMGGRNATQQFNTIYYAAINTDGTIGTWQTSSVSLPSNTWGHTAYYLKGYIYIVGGSNSAAENSAVATVSYARVNADNTLSAFSAGTSLPAARNKHSMVTYNSRLYILGGYDNAGTKASTVYIATPGLNGSTGAWTTGTALPVAISNHTSIVTNGLITVMAGAVGATLSNTVYYANADATTLTWNTSPNVMYDFTRDGAAFQGNGLVFYTGGTNLSGTPIINCRYANLTLTANYVNHGVFVSNPFYELGAERLINSLAFTATYTTPANCQVSYRTAGSNKIWSDWTALTSTSPITVNLTRQYLQYAVILTGSTTFNATFSDMTLTTPGTQLSGNLNATTTFTKALSPYWATSDISFTAGTHTFQAGATILFLPGTGMTIGQANIICSGTAVDSVKFMGYTGTNGLWNGIYFDPNSDNGVSSQFNYTVIANAGNGSNNANLYCNQTSEPLLNRCNIRYADGNGVRLNSAHLNIQNSVFRSNSENGAYLENSNPTFISSAISYNGGAGVFLTSTASLPNYSSGSTTLDHNLYGIQYPSPNFNINQPNGNPVLTANTYNGIAISGGDIGGANIRWNSITYDYILIGTVRIMQYGSYVRLTIEPGNTIKSLAGVQLQVGVSGSWGGELYALGTVDSLITFTSWNGAAGGWNGIWFTDFSDNWGGQSQLDYCVIEKGNDYNYLSENTSQPNLINHSKIQGALLDGARYSNAFGSITNCQFLNNGRYPLYYLNPEANPVHTGNTFTGNTINRIALSGGTYGFDRTIVYDGGVPYYVLDNINIALYGNHSRLTVNPGVVMEFAVGKKLQIGVPNSWGGDLYAIGTAGSPIIFKAYNNTAGGWEGIHFTDWNDNWGGTSVLEYCTITQGNAYNINCESSGQPALNHCTISNSALHGITMTGSSGSVQNCQFLNNNGYPLKYNDWTCNSFLKGNTYTGNAINYIALSGGDYSSDRTIYNDGIPYHVLGDIKMIKYGDHSRLILKPGITLAFDPGIKLQLGSGNSWGGDLFAEGKADSLITFKPYNNVTGGWAGIYFTTWNDDWGGTSSMKYCRVEKGANYNLNAENSGQPLIDHCTFTQSNGNGIIVNNSNLVIRNSSFHYNTGHGILFEGTGTATLGNTAAYSCNLYNNGGYEVYNNSSANVNARYNYWGTCDSTMIALSIYDKYDNAAKGIVYFGTFAQLPFLPTPTSLLGGTVKYANTGANPMKNAAMVIKDFGGTTIASTTTNTSGVYAFSAYTSGNYQMTITPSNAWGGGNGTDALLILNHFAQISALSGMKLAAADVNVSHTINGTDALYVMRRWAGLISSFPSGNYLYHTDTIFINGNQITNNFEMLCFGDVDASYGPVNKNSNSVGLIHEGSIPVSSGTEFNFPVKMMTGMEAGAISLGFYYPEEYLEITGAELSNGDNSFSWSAMDGLFRMAWCNLSTLSIPDEGVFLTIHMKSKDLSGLNNSIALQLYEDSEFADGAANVAQGVVLSVPVIERLITGIDPNAAIAGLSVFPNPFNNQTSINFSLQKESKVSFKLYDLIGNMAGSMAEVSYPAGNHHISLDATGLVPGLYILKMELPDEPAVQKMIRIVVSK
ncbi:MAG: right-handed parallel beta-helix repeat-containing protein [Lentimicrobium sp.]